MPETNGGGAGNEKPQQEPADQKSLTKAQVKRPAVQEKDQQPQQQEHPEQESPRGDVLNGRAAEDEASLQQEPAEQKSATGASLPALLLSTAHAVVLSASHSFTSALPLAAHAFRGTYAFSAQQPSKENGDAERQFLDTARGPAGDYRNAHRAGQGNGGLPAGIKPHVWVSFLSLLCAHSGLQGKIEHTKVLLNSLHCPFNTCGGGARACLMACTPKRSFTVLANLHCTMITGCCPDGG